MSFEIHLVENSKVTRNLLLLTAIFTSQWYLLLPDKFVDECRFLGSASFSNSFAKSYPVSSARGWRAEWIKSRGAESSTSLSTSRWKAGETAYSIYVPWICFLRLFKAKCAPERVDDSGTRSVFDIISRMRVQSIRRIPDLLAKNFIRVR